MRNTLFLSLCLLSLDLSGQELTKVQIGFYKLMEMIVQAPDSIFDNQMYGFQFEVVDSESGEKEAFLKKFPGPITKKIFFTDCIFKTSDWSGLHFEGTVDFIKCEFDYLALNDSKFKSVSFGRCTFGEDLYVGSSTIGSFFLNEFIADHVWISTSTLGSLSISSPQSNSKIEIRTCEFDSLFGEKSKKIEIGRGYGKNNSQLDLSITNVNFHKGTSNDLILIRGNFSNIFLDSLQVESNIAFLESQVQNSFTINNSTFDSHVSFHDLVFPPSNTKIRWDQLRGYKLNKYYNATFMDWAIGLYRTEYTWAKKDSVVKSTADFEDLIFTYQTLFNNYKLRGDIESANGCYSEMKDLQTARLKFLYQQNKTFNNFFRWKLAQLMKVYTNHGTDPALSITISMYVILVFGIFYFFYPSDWDVTSKSRLITNFKDFIQKNEKGYFKPFIALACGFILSLINALTLSLNSFTTLGFGNIPTHGLARYVCVIEGFIGWFLLSIFTVALINQVLS